MPELPEVESLRQKITPLILNKTISAIKVRRRDLRYPIPKNFEKNIKGAKVLSLTRRSKYLCINLDNHFTWVVHLGMSGRLFFSHPQNKFDKHDHVMILWDDNKQMRFRDPRRFGLMTSIPTEKISEHRFFKHLGVEPLEREFNANYFYKISKNKKAPIKSFIMNANYIVGVGNIYANESLFLSKIHPERLAKDLNKKEIQNLCQNIKKVLRESIQKGGTTLKDYVGVNEEPGLYRLNLNVYGRSGKPCLKCKNLIESITQAGRSSFYCSQCQK